MRLYVAEPWQGRLKAQWIAADRKARLIVWGLSTFERSLLWLRASAAIAAPDMNLSGRRAVMAQALRDGIHDWRLARARAFWEIRKAVDAAFDRRLSGAEMIEMADAVNASHRRPFMHPPEVTAAASELVGIFEGAAANRLKKHQWEARNGK
ncbi:MAG: hypothetical protein ACEQSH_00405 [Bacteroidia bacterium]